MHASQARSLSLSLSLAAFFLTAAPLAAADSFRCLLFSLPILSLLTLSLGILSLLSQTMKSYFLSLTRLPC